MKRLLLTIILLTAASAAYAEKADTLTYASGAEAGLDGEFLTAAID